MTQDEILQLQKCAELGNADCQYRLAMMHIYGDGIAEDNIAAFELLQKAAAQNHTEAIYNLGICHHYGYGTEVDLSMAFYLYLKSANSGYGKGMELVGRFYNQGIYVARNREKAEYWLKRAMDSEDAEAAEEAGKELIRCPQWHKEQQSETDF